MTEKLILVLDCGATNIRAIAVNEKSELVASHSISNNTQADPNLEGGLIWDIEEMWGKLVTCTHKVLSKINKDEIAGITVTTFGVNGSPVDKSGKLLSPVISWQCQRTVPIMDNIDKYIPMNQLYSINGLQSFSFNTINSMIWYKENAPEAIDQMDTFLFISSIFLHKLSGELVNDTSMAGTSMLTDISSRQFSNDILNKIDLPNKFGELVEPGTVVGHTIKASSEELGIPQGIPVVATGHDTQFAIFGSGAKENEVVLSSGTWEILMARTKAVSTSEEAYSNGITNEFDAIEGLYNPGLQWLGSGVLEWLINILYSREKAELPVGELYDMIISKAAGVKKTTLQFGTDFLNSNGSIGNLNINSKREEIYRAALEALAQQTADKLKILEEACKFKAESLVVVGGGSKNQLWNQLRANALGIPVKLIDKKETTVVGAALFAMAGVGIYKTADEARDSVEYKSEFISAN